MIATMTESKTTTVRCSTSSKDSIDRLAAHFRRSQREVVDHLIEWFVAQDEDLQALIVNVLTEGRRPDVARMVLEEMADQDVAGQITPKEDKPRRRAASNEPRRSGGSKGD